VARALGEANSERFFVAELRRLQGELLLVRGADDEDALARAEAALREAMQTAQAQGARAWELRAACSLAGVLAQRGRADEARRVTEEVLAAYTGEPSTPELESARTLVDSLG
jgi:hypothetical protein